LPALGRATAEKSSSGLGRVVDSVVGLFRPAHKPRLGLQGKIARSGADEIKLLEILPSSPPFVYSDESLDHVWCLIVHEERFTLEGALEWLKTSKSLNLEAGRSMLPSTTLLVRTGSLSTDELYLISTELRPTGALLCKWDRDAETIDAAFESLRVQLKSSYGEPNFDRSIEWGRTPAGVVPGVADGELVCR
jgi:hypothetical protein